MVTASALKSRARRAGLSSPKDDRSKLTFTTSMNFTPAFLLIKRSTENSEPSLRVCGSVDFGNVGSDSTGGESLGRKLSARRESNGLIAILNCFDVESAKIQRS